MMQVRIRMNHTYTQKDGWRLNEDTAEITFNVEDNPNDVFEYLNALKAEVYRAGSQIAHERNVAEGRA